MSKNSLQNSRAAVSFNTHFTASGKVLPAGSLDTGDGPVRPGESVTQNALVAGKHEDDAITAIGSVTNTAQNIALLRDIVYNDPRQNVAVAAKARIAALGVTF